MAIVVMVKQVPDTYAERTLAAGDHSVDRDATDAVLDEINERALEAALQLEKAMARSGRRGRRRHDGPGPGCGRGTQGLGDGRRQGGARCGRRLHGTDALGTARVLAKAIGSIDGVDLVLAGNEASDGRCGAVPAVVAEILGCRR